MDSWCGLREKKFVRSGGGWGVFDAEHNSPDLACGITLILQAFRVRAFKIVTCSGSVPMLQKYFAPPPPSTTRCSKCFMTNPLRSTRW